MSEAAAPLRVLALMEADSVTGPAKNLIQFAVRALHPPPGFPSAEIRMVTLQRGTLDPPNAYVAAVRQASLPIDVIPEKHVFDFSVIPPLRALVERYRPDIVQTHHYKLHFLMRLSRLYRRTAWLAFHHGYTATSLRVRCYNQLDRWSLRPARRIVTVCEPFARQLRRLGIPASRISIQHNSILPFVEPPERAVVELRGRLHLPDEAKVIVTVGRLSAEKGHRDLLEAAALLHRTRPSLSFRLIVVGEGLERGRIERCIDALGLRGIAIMVGHQADVRPFYAMADVFVLPSHSEGSPNALLEAMSAGIPCVATAVGGVPEIARDGDTAVLVRRGDARGMAAGIARILEDPVLSGHLGPRAREVTASYTPDVYCRSILSIYRQVAAEFAGCSSANIS